MARIKRVCIVEGCGKWRHAHGFCASHFFRWRRHGDPLGGGPSNSEAQGERLGWLFEHAGHGAEACLIWPFSRTPEGYANVLWYGGRQVRAYRVMCMLAHGDPPTQGHHAAHSCGQGHQGCIAPRHLRWATPVENAEDRERHGTQTKGRPKLKPDLVREIYERRGTAPQTEVAAEMGVSNHAVWRIWNGISWRDLTGAPDDKSRARRKAIRLSRRGPLAIDAWDDRAA